MQEVVVAVFTQIRKPDEYFRAFYKDNGLLIQFIMEEFARSYALILNVKTLLKKELDEDFSSNSHLLSIKQALGQLIGYFPEQDRPSFSRWTKGSLTKFKEYCEQFSRNSSHKNKHQINLHMAAHKSWLAVLHSLELVKSLHMHSSLSNEIPFTELERTFETLHHRFNQVIRYLPPVINIYSNDENVLLCLLRKKALLKEIYGSDFLHKRFKCSTKNQDLLKLLAKRYQERGFETLLPIIEQALES